MENFEEILGKDLHKFLLSVKEVDERFPECPDVEEKWEDIANAYIPDGIREFQDFPSPYRSQQPELQICRHIWRIVQK